MPDPTEDDLKSPEFEAVWQAIKRWDINAPYHYDGYCGANGSHVMLILNALRPEGFKPREPDVLYAERIAQAFHENYEMLAPEHGYETRKASAVPWEDVPEQNRNLMIAVVRALIGDGVIVPVRDEPEPAGSPMEERITRGHAVIALGYMSAELRRRQEDGEDFPDPPEMIELWEEGLRVITVA